MAEKKNYNKTRKLILKWNTKFTFRWVHPTPTEHEKTDRLAQRRSYDYNKTFCTYTSARSSPHSRLCQVLHFKYNTSLFCTKK